MVNTAEIRIYRTAGSLFFFILVLLISGCSSLKQPHPQPDGTIEEPSPVKVDQTPDPTPANPIRFDAEQVMVDDLLTAIVQVLPPINTTIQIRADDDNELTLMVADSMARIGYGIRKVTADQGPSLLSTETKTKDRSNNSLFIKDVRIDIGQISIGRAYSLTTDRKIEPYSPFKVYGSRIPIDYTAVLLNTNQTMAKTEYLTAVKLDEPLPLLSLITPEVVQSAAGKDSTNPELTSINSAKVEVSNLHFGESSFSSALDNRVPIDDLTLIFPNDSTILGNDNKLLLRQFMGVFIERLDLVNVIGCSNGTTASDLGNVGLALGRGERVTGELLSLGVPREKILDQGCWAPSAGGKYPSRGVVIELWREKA